MKVFPGLLGRKASKRRLREDLSRVKGNLARTKDDLARVRLDRDRAREHRDLYHSQRNELRKDRFGALTTGLLKGQSFESASVAGVRHMLDVGHLSEAQTFGQALMSREETKSIGAIIMGIFLAKTGFEKAALGYFSTQDQRKLTELASIEFADCLLASGQDDAADTVIRIADNLMEQSDFATAFQLAQSLMKVMRISDAMAIVEKLPSTEALRDFFDENDHAQLDWIRTSHGARATPVGIEHCGVQIGLMDYKLLDRDRTSSNAGDYVQTLAAFANVARHQNITFQSEDPALTKKLTSLQARVDEKNSIKGEKPVTVSVVPVDRDYASGRHYLKPTWMISNGWFMHANGRGDFDFPYPDDIRPIFISFHINHNNFLTEKAVEYLKRFEPIGCRDWTTVYRLQEYGVEAFFSGCLTTTVGLVFGPHKDSSFKPTANVEATLTPDEKKAEIESFEQLYDGVRDFSMARGLDVADEMLEGYRKFGKIITSRLHCYLPCRSIGLKVDFRPRFGADIRFDGLDNLDENAFADIRKPIEDKLQAVLTPLFSGQPEDKIRSIWRDVCAEDVSLAKQRIENAPVLPKRDTYVKQAATDILGTLRTFGPQPRENNLNIALAVDSRLADQLLATVASVCANTKSSLSINVMTRDLPASFAEQMAARWPEVHFRVFDMSNIDYSGIHLLSHTTVATMDRLFLPEILRDVDRLAYLDVDTIVLKDIKDLLELDMGQAAIAGRPTNSKMWRTGTSLLDLKATKQDAPTARKMRLWAYASGPVAFEAFNAGVLVMEMERLRQDSFTEKCLATVEAFGFHDQDAINFYCRGQYIPLDLCWNFVPSQDYYQDPSLIHWAGPNKPWGEFEVLHKSEYKKAVALAADPNLDGFDM
ncbi:glycosyltransferase [Yoonia sediminilitoris]|uniref:Lipopolysaccharide biosynthesis glycosyltransferase n=1 Tax=Yoonia sediminilitoris TaxID=1286148 RepID=A0A2T6KE05_9RHOB|nr:glycosyltransferase [Yoonia sediminilitoris]PUB13259.1 lipopolysaccharide biosynthesis glycosyltransferase [Yoonia sediminilitoris]RCW94594.1 lipopolysaccharide biosynthesis glycosyltransferase [Yoonia sediminilitoris]